MSSSKLHYDKKAYDLAIKTSKGPGNYLFQRPCVENGPCFNINPSIRLQETGVSVDSRFPLIDIDSELMGLNYKYSKDPEEKYHPNCDIEVNSGYPCGQGVIDDCEVPGTIKGSRPVDKFLDHKKDCYLETEYTRLDGSCGRREIGINRWEWLCKDPQEHVLIPFDHNINNRLVVKDNHRPCLPVPGDQMNGLPKGTPLPCNDTDFCKAMEVNTKPVSVRWKKPIHCKTEKPCAVYTDPSSLLWKQC
jgi:hypothetical protein